MKKENIYKNFGLYWLKDFLFNDSSATFIARIIVCIIYLLALFLNFGLIFLGLRFTILVLNGFNPIDISNEAMLLCATLLYIASVFKPLNKRNEKLN